MSFACGTLIVLGLKDLLQKENDLHLSGDWRKKLYLLEQKDTYTLSNLYVLNSYINSYSTTNDCSKIINYLIVCIINNYKNKNNTQYTSLKDILINYLKNNK